MPDHGNGSESGERRGAPYGSAPLQADSRSLPVWQVSLGVCQGHPSFFEDQEGLVGEFLIET
mgnify:CR=1 FL=1